MLDYARYAGLGHMMNTSQNRKECNVEFFRLDVLKSGLHWVMAIRSKRLIRANEQLLVAYNNHALDLTIMHPEF